MADGKKRGNIASVCRKLLEKTIVDMGYMLWDLEYVKEGSDYYLRITIDKEDGITIDDCEAVHQAVDPLLDEADPIPDSYHLEVSSPGIERELRTEEHFLAMLGSEVEVRLFHAVDGKKSYTGILEGYADDTIRLTTAEGPVAVKRADVSRAMTIYDFDADETETADNR